MQSICNRAQFLGFILTTGLLTNQAAGASWNMDADASKITFSYTQSGNKNTGQFDRFSSDIIFDPADLANASISAEIDITSFNSGNSQIDGAVSGSDWFQSSDFATANFQSSAIVDAGDGNYKVTGDLTIKGNTVPVTLTGPITIGGDKASAEMSVSLNRTDYNVGQGDFESETQVAHEVPVTITIAASRN